MNVTVTTRDPQQVQATYRTGPQVPVTYRIGAVLYGVQVAGSTVVRFEPPAPPPVEPPAPPPVEPPPPPTPVVLLPGTSVLPSSSLLPGTN